MSVLAQAVGTGTVRMSIGTGTVRSAGTGTNQSENGEHL